MTTSFRQIHDTMALRCPDLPFLPGYTFNPMLGKTKFNMDPKFDFIGDGVPALVEKVRPNMFGPLSDKYPSLYPRGEVLELPSWIAFDKQILCFDAFFKETLQEVRGAPFSLRRVKIYFFLEDGTIQVIEPKVENSGIAQGTLICRHRIRFPAPMDDNFYEVVDLNVGKEVEFYGRVFKITDCDKFTRNFLNRCGIHVPDSLNIPGDPFLELRNQENARIKKRGKKKDDSLGKFLENDRKVLRFYGYWDDQETVFGYLHRLEILYYLADDTIEIREVSTEDCNKKTTFIFLHRDKIPKTYKELPMPGANCASTVLNVLGPGLQGGRFIKDPLSCGVEVTEYYCEKDLFIGSVINCYGRKLVLTDCDPYTREYYRSMYGLNSLDAIAFPEDKHAGVKVEQKERELPPWNGYGSYEDSAQNCITVEPKAPHRDFKKFLNLDRIGIDSHILRFEARMLSKIPENCTRHFVISYYLADDTIAVFERGIRNSGFDTKEFFARRSVALPNQGVYTSKPPITYKSQDMYVGATLIINSFKFVLIDADEYALRYMEIHDHQYPKANIKVIMGKIREKLRPTYKDFVAENMPKESTTIPYDTLKAKLLGILGDDFTEHEMITIARAFPGDVDLTEKYDREKIRAITLTELKRGLWDDLARLREYFLMRDPHKSGVLPRNECYIVLRACRLPLEKELVDKILQVIQKDNEGNLCYEDILNFVNRDICKLPDVEPISLKHELSCIKVIEYEKYKLINWCEFNKFLDLEDTFKEQPVNNTIERLQKNK
ncbi:EF-hand domain-containing family member C2 [Tribolium castaneum]|nr:PREDICTED: EF-hand domain-containing family member C2 [Tribolium castaneum]|eukprot:XP_974278.2 PREDICTED: EF-hand domain-containing family member C2 [Tribolium castaneum]